MKRGEKSKSPQSSVRGIKKQAENVGSAAYLSIIYLEYSKIALKIESIVSRGVALIIRGEPERAPNTRGTGSGFQ